MNRRNVILIGAFLGLGGVSAFFLAASPPSKPLTVSFLGYTNEPAGSEAAAAARNEFEAVFQLSNQTGSELQCHFDFDAVSTNGLSSWAGGECYLAANGARRLLIPAASNGWRFQAVVSASGSRPPWQRRTGTFLSRIGMHPAWLAGDRKYPRFTNVWSKF